MKNNLFSFATSELSQDAFICWCVNWANFSEADLFDLGVDFFKMIGITLGYEERVEIKRQFNKIDVLLVLNKSRKMIIIEDKTFTSEHDDQIKRYRELLTKEIKNLDINDNFDSYEIITVYFKTGFFYDYDRMIENKKIADVIINGEMFLKLLRKYSGQSEILDDYIEYLESLVNWYNEYGDYTKKNEQVWYISKEHIAQYKFIKTIWGENYNREKEYGSYYVYSGSSFGRPWTQMTVLPLFNAKDFKGNYEVFWRIDTDQHGPYISLRLYEKLNKNNPDAVADHENLYKNIKDELKKIVDNSGYIFKWEEIKSGNTGRYKESSIISIGLEKYLRAWDKLGSKLVKDIKDLTEQFIIATDNIID